MRAAKRVIEIQKDSEVEGEIIAFHSIIHHDSESDIADHKKKVFDEIEKLFKEVNLSIETRMILEQKPEDYIIDIVEKENFNLVVLGYSGTHGFIKRRLLGSIPTEVMNNVKCDVLIVK